MSKVYIIMNCARLPPPERHSWKILSSRCSFEWGLLLCRRRACLLSRIYLLLWIIGEILVLLRLRLLALLLRLLQGSRCFFDGRLGLTHILEVGSVANVSAEIFARQQSLLLRLEDWYSSFTGLANNQPNPVYQSAISTLRTFHAAIYIILSTCLTQHETAFDNYLLHFRTIVDHASQALATSTTDTSQTPFTFESGVGQPLFFTAISCRDPVLRREALSLPRRVLQEGFFECEPRVASAEEYIRMEEGRIKGLMVRVSDLAEFTDSMISFDYSSETGVENGVKEIPLERLADLPSVEDLVNIEEDFEDNIFSGYEQCPVLEGHRIRKNVVVQLNSLPSNGIPQSRPFLHFTRNRPNRITGAWEEREYFLPLNPTEKPISVG